MDATSPPPSKRAKGDATSTFQWFANSPGEDTLVVSSEPYQPTVMAVFDGHNGPDVSAYCAAQLLPTLQAADFDLAVCVAMLDQSLAQRQIESKVAGSTVEAYNWSVQGCTATIAVLHNGVLKVAQLGDSRAVVGVQDPLDASVTHVVRMGSHDHNARELMERAIVEARLQPLPSLWKAKGGADSPCVYFLGMLQLTRALGNHYLDFDAFQVYTKAMPTEAAELAKKLKKAKMFTRSSWRPLVSITPDVDEDALEHARFVIVASDGLWDYVSMDLAVQSVQSWGRDEPDPAGRLGRLALCKAAFKAGVPLQNMLAVDAGSEARRLFDDITIVVHWL